MGDINPAPLFYTAYFFEQYKGWIGASVVVLLGAVCVTIYNRMVRSWTRVGQAWSDIDVQLRRRASLVPNLVETVKGYAGHESHVFEEVTRTRSALVEAKGAAEAARADAELTQALSRLFAVAENYPQLSASENFLELQKELSDVEEKIAYARQFYNANAQDYNTRIRAFPGLLFAFLLRFDPAAFFQAPEEARSEIKVDFHDLK